MKKIGLRFGDGWRGGGVEGRGRGWRRGRVRGGGWSRLLKNNKAITSNPQMYCFTPTYTADETAAMADLGP